MADKVKVKLTLRDDEPWEVDPDEIPDLHAQRLLADGEPERLRKEGLLAPDATGPDPTPGGQPLASVDTVDGGQPASNPPAASSKPTRKENGK